MEHIARGLSCRIEEAWAERFFGSGAEVVWLEGLVTGLWIRDRRGDLTHLHPNAAQQQYARERGKRNIILKPRQVGMTTYIAARFFLSTIFQPGTVTLQVAHSQESAQQIFRIVQRFFVHSRPKIRHWLAPGVINVREMAFERLDSRYLVDTVGNKNVGRGLTVNNLHASEVALWPGMHRRRWRLYWLPCHRAGRWTSSPHQTEWAGISIRSGSGLGEGRDISHTFSPGGSSRRTGCQFLPGSP